GQPNRPGQGQRAYLPAAEQGDRPRDRGADSGEAVARQAAAQWEWGCRSGRFGLILGGFGLILGGRRPILGRFGLIFDPRVARQGTAWRVRRPRQRSLGAAQLTPGIPMRCAFWIICWLCRAVSSICSGVLQLSFSNREPIWTSLRQK